MIETHIEYCIELLLNKEGLYEVDEYEEYSNLVSEYPSTYIIKLYDYEENNGVIENCLFAYIFEENLPIDRKAIAELIDLKDYMNDILSLFVDTDYRVISI